MGLIMIHSKAIQKICSEYDIGEYIAINKIDQGVLNDNYFLETTTGKYFIKSVREKARGGLKTIYGIEFFMKNRGIPAVAMLETKSGDIFITENLEVYTLYHFIEGDKSGGYTEQDYRNMGEMLGKIHQVGNGDVSEVPDLKQFKRPDDQIILERLKSYKDLINNKADQDETDKKFLEYIDLKLVTAPKIKPSDLPNDTLIHGDYHPENLLIDENTREIIGVCDWEKAEFGPRAYELARALLYSCFSDGYQYEDALRFSKQFVDGYVSVYPMSKEEIMGGLNMRIHRTALSAWIEEKYYKARDDRANKFIGHEIDLIDNAVNGNLLTEIQGLLQ